MLATDDPDERRIALDVGPRRRGVQAIDAKVEGTGDAPVAAVGIGFRSVQAERMLGFGERSDNVDQRGNVVESYVGEGPLPRSEYPVVSATIPPWGLRQRSDATYFPMPWLLSTRGYGVLVDNLETSRFRLGTEARGRVERRGRCRAAGARLFAGPRPATSSGG